MVNSHARATACVAAAALALLAPLTASSAAVASPGQDVADLTVTTPEGLAATLAGPGVTVSNVNFLGARGSSGSFSGFASIGIDAGVALTTGSLATQDAYTSAILGPNTSSSTTTDNFQPGDADLDALAGETTQDASVLEFDFVPTERKMQFRYVFGSEEYPEWVGQNNDLMGLWINGVNCALVDTPSGPSPVSVNAINADTNASLYRDNSNLTAPSYDTQLDGLTTVLTCTVSVTPGAVNHLKVAIADVGDGYRDSAVLLEAGTQLPNSVPVVDPKTATVEEGATVDVPLTGTDADGDPLSYAIETQPTNGTVTVTGTVATYTPNPGFTGTDSFTYTANDGYASSPAATVTVTVAPIILPTAGTSSVSTNAGTAVVIPVLADSTGEGIEVASVGSTPDGTVTINSDGTLTFTPNSGYAGTTRFEYTVRDRNGRTATGTVTVTVAAAAVIEPPAGPIAAVAATPVAAAETVTVLAATGSNTDGALGATFGALLLVGAGALLMGFRRLRKA